jgi:5-methylcytosine-specific restriction endonuclease McrA
MTTARELTNHLALLLRKERSAMADFLVALSEFHRNERWRELGHTSLFYFLRRELGLSAGAAQYRKTATELVQRYPEIEAALRAGDLCLSSVVELAKVVTLENAAEVVPRFFGLSSREAAAVAASIRPIENPPERVVVTRFPPPASAATSSSPPSPPEQTTIAAAPVVRAPEPSMTTSASTCATALRLAARTAAPDTAEPLDADRVRLHLTVPCRLLAKIEALKEDLARGGPALSSAEVLEACVDLMLARRDRRKGLVAKPSSAVRPSKADAVPAHVRRSAWLRAGGRCEWVFESGERCGCTTRLELDHVIPRARGGPSTIDNVRILCRAHNGMAARVAFGDAWMNRFTRKRGDAAVPRPS